MARYARIAPSLRSGAAWRSDGAHSRVSLATLELPPRYARVPPDGLMVRGYFMAVMRMILRYISKKTTLDIQYLI